MGKVSPLLPLLSGEVVAGPLCDPLCDSPTQGIQIRPHVAAGTNVRQDCPHILAGVSGRVGADELGAGARQGLRLKRIGTEGVVMGKWQRLASMAQLHRNPFNHNAVVIGHRPFIAS